MTLSSLLSTAVIFYVIFHVYSKETDQEFVGSELLREEASFYRLLEMTQHDNKHAELLMNVKKSLESKGKTVPSTVYKRMKTKFLKSLQSDYLRRRALYDEQAHVYAHVQCGLRVIPVEVPHLPRGISYPAFMNLHQCVGGCAWYPNNIHCAVTSTSPVLVKTYQYDSDTPEGLFEKVETLLNHTKCDCQCIVQKHHCNKITEEYNPDECTCVCKNLSHTCNSTIKKWDNTLCGCTCKAPPKPCRINKKLWNEDTCDCQCVYSVKKRCARKNKLLNKDTCDCYCSPDIVCPAGTELHKYDCSCTEINSL